MKTKLAIAFVLALGLAAHASAQSAAGSAFGSLTTATTLGQGHGNFGGGVGIADATSVFGTFTYGLSKYTDGRIRLGFRDDVDAELTFGADFKWQFWNVGQGRREPLDMALGGFFEYTDFGPLSVFQFGGQLFASHPFQLSRSGALSPYGRFNARMESFSGGGASETELEFGLNAGVAWQATPAVALFGEFQLDGNDGVFFGIDFNIM